MRYCIYILLAVSFALGNTAAIYAAPGTNTDSTKEYQIKVAFLYNFFNFIEWPHEKSADSDHVTIGIVATKDSQGFIDAMKPLTQKQVQGKSIVLKIFDNLDCFEHPDTANQPECQALIESMKQCHLLMVCECNHAEIRSTAAILKALKGTSTLTVGERPSFLENGGIINFVVEDNKIRFEVNLAAARESNLLIHAKLLKLAKRVINEK